MYLKAFLQKTTLWFLAVLSLFLGVYVYATIDRTVVIPQQIVVVPDTVVSDTWSNLGNSLLSDISNESLYQDFSVINSAYIDSPSLEYLTAQETSVVKSNLETKTASSSVVKDESVDVNIQDSQDIPIEQLGPTLDIKPREENVSESVDFQNYETEPLIVPNTVDSEIQDDTESTPELAPIVEESAFKSNSNFFLGALPSSNKIYPLVQEIITTQVSTAEESIIEPPQEEISEAVTNEVIDIDIASSEEAVEESIIEPPQEEITEEEINKITTSVDDVCAGVEKCKMYSAIFSGFTIPEFESGNFLTSAQLRLSLAASTLSQSSSGPQRFVIEYKYTEDSPWLTASTIDIEDEASNSINGGYYLISLERPSHQSQLSLLQVRVSYQGDIELLEKAYIESLWLEVNSALFYEETDPNYLDESLDYSRDLEKPKFHELNNSGLDLTINELPSFTLSYSPQEGFFKKILTAIFSENEYSVSKVNLIDNTGVEIHLPINVLYQNDKTWTIQFQKNPQKLVPGKYKIKVTVSENESVFIDEFEFYWGVLAVNTKKSMYFPNEEVKLNLAALTDRGDTICDAILELKIINPKNEFFEVPVEQSGSCDKNNVTDIPDYLASFSDTGEWGLYKIQLQHKNKAGEVVHKIEENFEVRDYIPFDIERTAPTRIYPPSPYSVNLNITAYRDFTGDINEKVPRGFIIENLEGAVISSLPEYTLITWKDVTLKEGEKLNLSYRFDAPDISPYMYLLGPLDMDGFSELRQWQIASDALNNIGWFEGTRTVSGTNLNAVLSPMQWSTSSVDNYYFTHSTSSNSHQVTLRQAGDYFISVTLPQERVDANNVFTRIGIEVRVNGVAVPQGLGRSGFIRGNSGNNHSESSSHATFLLTNVSPNDYVEVFVTDLTSLSGADTVNVTGQAAMYIEYISSSATVFAATATSTVASTSLNLSTASALTWTETRQDSGFVHSDSVNPENIIISNPGTYMVHVSVPLETYNGNTVAMNVLGRVLLDGTQVSGGVMSQGFSWGNVIALSNDFNSSIHWSGIVTSTTTNQVLTVTTEQEASAGTTTVPAGFVGSIYIEPIPSDDIIVLTGTTVSGATPNDWSPAAQQSVLWTNRVAYDSVTFTHSTTSTSSDITINEGGDYLITYNDALTSAGAYTNVRVTFEVDGVAVVGAQTKSHLMRNTGAHNNSSGAIVYLLEGITAGQVVRVRVEEEATNQTVDDAVPAILTIAKKAALNERPIAPTMFNTPFDNIRFASTTPAFEFQSSDPDGTSDLQYEFSISTTSDFTASVVRTSGVDAAFSNAASSSDTSPFIETNKIRFQLQSADALTDLLTYYWRVRAKDVTGSNGFGDWSTTQSLTVNLAATVPNWYQTYTGQLNTNTLVGAVSSGDDRIQVDSGANSEILIAYGDATSTVPRYRLWNGTSWGTQFDAQAVGGTINWVRTAAGVTRNEYVMLTIDQSNSAYAQVYNSTTTSWGNQTLLTNAVNNRNHKGIAIGYESLSGDAMAVSCDSGAAPVYRIWNGTSWSATSTISVSLSDNCSYLEIASDPASDEMILVIRDSGLTAGSDYEALVWNGGSWIANRVLGSVQAGQLDRAGIGLAYEASGQQAVVAVTNGTNPNIAYTVWDGTIFATNATQPLGNDFEFGHLSADTDTDDMALCYVDEDTDAGVLQWNGGGWQTFQEIELTPNSNTGRPIDCEFETVAGRDDNLFITYSDTVNTRYQPYSGTWPVTEQTITGIEDSFWVQTERAGDGTIVMVSHDDAVTGDEIESSYFNGTSWSTKQSVVPNPSSIIAAPYETYEMAAKRFQFTQGVVTTQPISFSFVPNRTTWGDLSFSTTEPFGTDVKVKLKYSSTTACDTYIPNGALPGNAAGFDVGSSTLNISGLSTTTYSQICLEASITTLGSQSASLDDWSVTWQREAKLVQNNYRWYANGSFLTPTDPWPVGVTDLQLNTDMSASEAVNINDVVRLRMSLQGLNIDLASTTKAFKLQYAAGQTCTPLLSWTDVGAPASTSALWRGYDNAIVGSDWLSSSWVRRLKITVEGTLVTGAQTNFPVYVNLDDLPDSFFAKVQSDGDDIRITNADGITEVPYELVSINIATKKGELHFKGTLASTTDTDFYIYYDNPAASGYAVTATYGRNNVWTNGYEAVYHLETSPASNMTDSTVNGRTLTTNGGMAASQSTTSVMGNGVDFDGINDRLTNATWAWQNGSNTVTVTAWNNVTTAETKTSNLFGFTASGNERLATHAPWSDATIYWDYGTCCGAGGRVNTSYSAYRNKWTHIGLVSQGGSGAFMGIYLDGSVIASSTSSDDPNVTLTGFSLGSDNPSGGNHHDGRIDEYRIASVARSAGWIRTERTNQSNPTGFYAISAEELIGDGRTLPSTILTGSDYAETYEERNPTSLNLNTIVVGNDAEWDFVLQNYGGVPNTEYCFRMVYDDGSTLNTYTRYPKLITNSPPPAPTLLAPFDNEQSSSTAPVFEFYTDDALSDDVSYQIEIDNNYDFGSVTVGRESNANFSLFTNLSNPSERGIYTTGNTIQFIPNATLSNGTYYWRVRAKDDNGSGAYGDWSTPFSFTVASTSITTWLQTTGEQFNTNNLLDAVISTSTNDVGILTSFTNATVTSTAIDYDDRDTGNAWGQFSFTHNVTSGSIRYHIEYNTGGDVWALIPDSALSGNSAGFTTSPVSLIGLNTTTYNQIRITAALSGTPSLPRLLDWKVEWGETIDIPTLLQPFDNAKISSTLPQLTFFTTDPQSDNLQYEVQISTSYNFTSSSTYLSGVDSGFADVTNGADTSPYASGDTIQYTVQSALTSGVTYWWRVRARDPDIGDSNIWSEYNTPQSFTVDTASLTATWFQTTGEQFATDDNVNIETPSGGAQITSVISEVMSVYGEGAGQSPQYRLWNGTTWSAPESAETVDAQIRWTRLKAAPTRPEYVLGTLGTDLDINVQVYNGVTEAWGNKFEIFTESTEATKRRFDLSYETTSGDLVAVACAGVDAQYSVWNGSSWSATTTIDLANTNDCEWVQLSSDPTSDEIVALFRHTNSSTTDFEALVWSGSSWGNSTAFGDIANNTYEGMAVNYEESGGQAVVVTSNNANNSFLWSAWNGSSWTTATATAVGDNFYWASLKRDVGTDKMALCYVDADNDIGVILWSGSAWNTTTEIDQNNNDINGRGVDCEYQTSLGTDGDLLVSYSDGVLSRYQTYSYASSSFSVENDLSSMNDGFYMQSVRGGDGTIHTYTLDDASNPDRYDTSRWNGSTWSTLSNFSTNPSITTTPFNGSIIMAAQIFPNFTEGSIRSSAIEFSSGNSPLWERIRWNDTTPGASDIRYRVYYEAATGTYALIPDSALSGNAAGFTNSPVSISSLDRTTYATLKLDAELICSSGNCPSVQDWSVEWSQGITISGSALGFDQLTAISTGTVAVAVNGVLQVGKTATLGSGTTTQSVVFDTAGTSTWSVPTGVTNVTVKAWGAGGGAGGGGTSDAGGAGGGAGFIQGNITVIPAEDLSIRIGGGGTGGSLGIPPGAGGGGGYSGVLRSSTPLAIAAGGGGGGGGTGGVRYVAVGTACAVSAASCTPAVPAGTVSDDVYIAVLHSRTNTAHTCTTNCTGWTEFSTQAGSAGEGRLSVWWYRQSGAAPANPTFAGPATESYTGRIWAYRGVANSGNPYDILGSNTAITVASTTFAGSNLNSTVADAMVVNVTGSMDNTAWGPSSGACSIPGSADVNFYSANAAGTDNSVSLCYKSNPLAAAGSLGTPSTVQSLAVVGRYFTFALRPNSSGIMAAGSGGVGGGLSGGAGVNASTTNAGAGGTQSSGGSAGGGSATIGSAYTGGDGSSGTGGGAGGAGGVNGGGAGGTGNLGTIGAAGGGGGAGYYGGGGANSASGPYIAGAGGGGGSSYIVNTATATSTQSGTTTQAGNNADIDYVSGVGVGNTSATSSNGSNGGVGRVVISWDTANVPGAWSISNVSALVGDVITVFMQNASGTAEAIGVTKYDGVGDISGMLLSQRHLTIGSNDTPTVTNANIGLYDSTDTEDVFFSVSGVGVLNLCGESTCGDARLRVLASSTYSPGANGAVINFQNNGTFAPATNTLRVSGTWLQNATFTPDTSTIIFTATTSSSTLQNATTSYSFHNVTFGETAGSATWNLTKPLDITGTLGIDFGTLARSTSSINVEQGIRIGASGFVSGLGTTTFDGSGSYTWGDAKAVASSTNLGYVVIDGTAKTVTLSGNVGAQSILIGADDTLNSSGSGYNINVVNGWINNNSFIPQTGTVTFTGTSTGVINRGVSSFNNLTFSGVGGNWSFSTSTLALNGTLTIATGTVTLPTGTTTVGGSFLNTGGTFAHNNGEVRMTSTSGGRTITQRATAFLNAFYDLVFSGSGAWTYTEASATTTRNMNILAGTVTLASSTLTVGGDFSVSGTGAFAHNNGEVILQVLRANNVRTNGSSFNNLRTVGGSGSWYNLNWSSRKSVIVNSSQVVTNVTDFPVYINLANLGSDFFSTVKSDGGDIRVTTSDGLTEVPFEIVSISTGGQTGELHFRTPTLSTSTNSTFYVYYGNSSASLYASTTAYGARNVWSNGYEAVYHLDSNPASTTIDSTRNGRNLTQLGSMNSSDVVAGAIGNGIDFDGTDDRLTNASFAWPNASNTVTVTAWNNVATAETKAANLFGFTESGGQRFATHGPWSDATLYWDFGAAGVPGRVSTSYASYRDKWTHVGLVSPGAGGGNMSIYLDGSLINSSTASDPSATLTGFFLGSLGAAHYHDGRIDEFRIASVVRAGGWIGTEKNNQASTTSFYSVGGVESSLLRTFTDINATILGNFIIGADSVLPTGVLSVGGSFDNNSSFNSSSGTVRFNSTAGAETIAAGSSTFATLEFNSATGDFTVTENATATVGINLTSVQQFTLASSTILTTQGVFSNAATGANTTWTGSTLRLLSGTSTTMNLKTNGGDTYGTLEAASSTLAKMWNSSATTYLTSGTTGAIYSQDHAGVDGDLYIFGNYLRNTGTEYWSYATDFDGTVLIASTSRQVDVRVSTSSTIGFTNASFNLVGGAGASTTIDAQTGAFALSATNTTLTAEYFTVAGTNASGFGLYASSTLSTFRDGFFTVVPGRTGITFSTSTINTNPSAQFFRIGFATTSAGTATNVTLVGTTTNFVWFRDGSGNLYGEAFDGTDANPGSIRFDDSSNSIVVSGVVYSDDGVTIMGTSTCNGTTPNVRVVVNGGTYVASTTCAVGTGAYSFPAVNYVGDPKIVVYLDTNGGVQGSVVTKTPTANITNMNIYANRVITRHQDILPLTASDMQTYDYDNDTDLKFIAATTSLILLPNTELYVFASTTFAPGGNITLQGNANANGYEGTVQIGPNATFTASSTETHTLGGRFVMATTSTFTAASSTFVFNATTTGKSITSPNTVTFNQIQFNGLGGGWNITAPLIVQADMNVATGTVTGTSNITLQNGSLYGNGVLSLGSGTTTINRSNTLGGTTAWTFNNLVLGNGSIVGTTTPASTATTTVLGRLTIANAHFLNAGNSQFDLAGVGSVFVNNGTFISGTSNVRYSGNNATILGTTYYNLNLAAAAGSSTFTGTAVGINVQNNLTVGGAASTTVTLLASDPVLAVGNSFTIVSAGTFVASDVASTTIAGSYANTGLFIGSGGRLTFTGSGTHTIAAGTSSFSGVTINGTGNFTVTQNATSTGSFILQNHSSFTLSSSTTLSLGSTFTNTFGGASTTFNGTLYFFGGGDRSINASTTNDVYNTLDIASGTNVRMWNSSASTYSGLGGIYSQKHSGTNGLLHIYGQFTSATANDYWSYATDFDGTALTGGSERTANVRFASGASATYSGGTLSVIGTSTATTTIANQGSGTFGLTIGGGTTNWNRVQIRDINSSGVVIAGAPTVTNFSNTDHLVKINSASALTVGGTAINANEAKSFTGNIFAADIGVTGAVNVTATGTAVSSWRFTNHFGDIAGEAFDSDPAGDPGYITWDDSAALITVSGTVFSDEGVTLSNVCDGVTNNIRLVIANSITDTTYNTNCNATTRVYSIPNVAYSPLDTLVVYIVGTTSKATTVSTEPISSIGNMNLYENRVILRHESTNPLTIERMSVWSSADDSDVQYAAIDSSPDTLIIPTNRKLIIWNGKTFEPNGNVTISGGGAGADYDGTIEAQTNAVFRAKTTESHSVGGSVIFGSGAVFTAASSTLTLTTTGAGRTFDINASSLHNLTVSGAGSYNFTDSTLTLGGSYTQSNGTVTFPTGTSTVGAAFNITSGSFTNSGSPFVFNGSGAGNTVRFNGSSVASLTFNGSGSWIMTDTNATSTGSVLITRGTVTLPSGIFSVGGSFQKTAGIVTHNTSDLIMTATSTALLTASSSDLYSVRFAGPAIFTVTDSSITFLDSFTIASGSVVMATGTTAVGGSFDATGGTFVHSSGTVLLNAAASGKSINPGSSSFYNLQIGAPSGGYTLYTATTTNNFTISSVNILTVNPGATIAVGGVFTNSVGGTGTTWTNSTLLLNGQNTYSVNTRSNAGDTYGTLSIGANSDIEIWYSSAATTTVNNSSSLYSQDHNNLDGKLYIYGDLTIATSTEYWSYATDFDGTALIASTSRQVDVRFAPNATTTVTTGSLQIIGTSTAKTTILNQATGTYAFLVTGGTLNANNYHFTNLNISGLQLSGLSTITDFSKGYFDLTANTGSLITLSSTTLNANPSKIFDSVGFNATTGVSGYNINLVGDTTNAWRFPNSYGNIGGEGFDIDGIDACGSIRFDNSSCLLTEQTHVRWRTDDGEEGAPDGEWYDQSFTYRKSVRVLNNDSQSYASTAVKVALTYDASMQSNFADLRFTTSDGQTTIPFWLEKYTASTDAEVWVLLPNLPASSYANVFMYYGSSTATSTSNGPATFTVIDDYEDNSISEYTGDTSLFTTTASPVYGGSYALKAANTSGKTTDGIFRFDDPVAQGEIIRYRQYINTSGGSGDETCTLFGVQSPGTTNNNYAVCLELFGTDRISLVKNAENNDSSGTILSSSTVTYSTGWYEVEIDWRTNNSMYVTLYNAAGTLVASTSATDSSYTSGGYGYAFWFQNGAWDSFTSRPRVATRPSAYLGAKQTAGGANWASALDGAGSALPGDTLRLRIAVENSGLDVTAQQYRLEYAPKDVAPTCESVSGGDYVQVPNQASCGSSPVCMQTSSFVTNGEVTTNLLFDTDGTFSAGTIVTSPSNQTSALDVDQNYYTELEYVVTPTVNATDAYCLRVTNAGSELDYYSKVAELGLQFDPVLSTVDLNGGLDISLTPGTTTAVIVTGNVTDYNGYSDLTHATATIYRSGAGAACTPDNNNCYVATTENSQCSFTGCSGDSCTLSCQVDMYFHADPTATGSVPYEGEEWVAYAEVSDYSDGYDFGSAMGVELLALRALDVDSLINYGALAADSDTGSFNPTTTVTNIGNVPINVDIEGTNLTDGLSSVISADLQKVATSSFTYSGCVSCQQLATSTPVTLGINLSKPSNPTPPVDTDIYWGIAVPFSASNAPHTGTNIFTAISAD